jgi:sodium-dependent dicarboxylate transporter 2/3/5
MVKKTGFLSGLIVFVMILLIPNDWGLEQKAKNMLACALLMAIWWLTEALPLAATALVPLALFPLLKIAGAGEVAPAYADPNIFLFMGGFMIAMAMQRHNLHRRIALHIIHRVGSSPKKIILGFMIATAFLSMWISNTATAMMMLPIGIAVTEHLNDFVRKQGKEVDRNLGLALMLGIAYSASIGGTGTLIGTPSNIVFAGLAARMAPHYRTIGFVDWLIAGIPVVVIFLPLVWFYLVNIAAPVRLIIPGRKDIIREELRQLDRMSKGEHITLTVFVFTALAWIFRKNIEIGQVHIPGWTDLLGIGNYVHDGTIAMAAAVLLFTLPTSIKKLEFTLNWDWAQRIPWGILLLFGGGFALAAGFQSSGLDLWLGSQFGSFSYKSVFILIVSVCFLLTFLTEITSNTATITMMLPVLAAMSVSLGVHPFLLMIPATLSTSFAFMMPVATPPNAIVFGSNYVRIADMARIGLVLNLIGIVLITTLMYLVIIPVLGL